MRDSTIGENDLNLKITIWDYLIDLELFFIFVIAVLLMITSGFWLHFFLLLLFCSFKEEKLVWIYLFWINHFESRRLPDWATSSEMALVKNSVLLNFELIFTLFLGQLIFKVIPKVTISKIQNLITLTFQKYPNPTKFVP